MVAASTSLVHLAMICPGSEKPLEQVGRYLHCVEPGCRFKEDPEGEWFYCVGGKVEVSPGVFMILHSFYSAAACDEDLLEIARRARG